MKKTLLLQTALVAAAGLFVADIANAQTKATPIGVTVGGYFNQLFVMQDADPKTAGQSDHRFANPGEIWFNIRGVLDNGTVIGARVELESQTYADQIDERYMFIERADVGRVEIGSVDSVTTKMIYAAPNSLPNYSTTVHEDQTGILNQPLMRFVNNNDDNERINLYTSSNRYFGSKAGKGLQLGFSYMPDGCQDHSGNAAATGASIQCGAGFPVAGTNFSQEQQYQVAANYLESFGPVDAALYAGFTSVKVVGTGAGTFGDRETGWQVGSQFAWNLAGGSQVQFGGGYNDEDVGIAAQKDREAFSLGLRYLTNGAAPGSVGVGVEYWNAEDKNLTSAKTDRDYYHLGVTYQVAVGILSFAGVGVSDVDAPATANDLEQTFGVLGINLTF